jgi:sugar phosphate isomerase/epimerase
MIPKLLFCHTLFGKHVEAVRDYVVSHHYDGVEWGLDGWRLMMAESRRRQLLERLRAAAPHTSLHGPYTDLEIGHRDPEHAAAAVRILMDYIDAAADMGAHHLNLHSGSYAADAADLSVETLVRSLGSLSEHAARGGVPITIENLRSGPTSEPESFAALLRRTGTPVTLDIGHAAGCPWVLQGRGTVAEFVRSVPTPILASHVYGIERNDAHFAPHAVADLAPALDALREKGCGFWVLELHSRETLEQTRRIVDEYLQGPAKIS